jgi:hypothetical protein
VGYAGVYGASAALAIRTPDYGLVPAALTASTTKSKSVPGVAMLESVAVNVVGLVVANRVYVMSVEIL